MTVIELIFILLIIGWLALIIHFWIKYGNPFYYVGNNFMEYFFVIIGTVGFSVIGLIITVYCIQVYWGDFIIAFFNLQTILNEKIN